VDQTGHGSSALLSQLVSDQTAAVLSGLGSVAVLGMVQVATFKLPRAVRLAVLAVLAAGCIYGLGNFDGGSDPEHWRTFVLGACEIMLALVALGAFKVSLALRIAAFLCLVELVFTPIGSDQGTRNAHWGMWVSLPFVIALPLALEGTARRLGSVGQWAVVFASIVAGEGLVRARTYTYREGPRELLTHAIPQPQLRGLRTTAERAKVLDEVVDALNARVAPGDYLLTSESTPLLLYLSRTRPYLGIPWIMVDENPAELKELFARAPREKGCVPVLVRARGNTRRGEWPNNARKGVDRKHAPARKVIASFLKAHDYRVTWRNSYFEILEPPSGKGCR
jgi:hypothetical protein